MANNNGYKKDNKAKQQPDYTSSSSILEPEDDKTTLMMERETCDVLCSLSSAPRDFDNRSNNHDRGVISPADSDSSIPPKKKKTTGITNNKTCQKQLQLPMFLSKTYHMVGNCDPSIATFSEAGDNFVVKDVDKFASTVLPLYFKHSNFSSFARQLNFYGFRKLRSDPILTTDADPQTSSYVRFYHEKFQKDKPELLHDIRRATKSDQQKTDNEVESLKREVSKLKDALESTVNDFNRRITQTNAEFEKLLQCVIAHQRNETSVAAAALTELPAGAAPTAAAGPVPATLLQQPFNHIAAATMLQNHQQQVLPVQGFTNNGGTKRKASDCGSSSSGSHHGEPSNTRQRF